MCTSYNKIANFSPPTSPAEVRAIHLGEIINSDPILSQYFRVNCPQDRYRVMAHELMLDGIRYRTSVDLCDKGCHCKAGNNIKKQQQQKINKVQRIPNKIEQDKLIISPNQVKKISNQKDNHYNVAYVKHNRFLSPKQKKQIVTPKITEMIPVKSQPLIIYGKPRVKVDNQCGCPYHNNEQQCLSTPYGGTKTPRQNAQRQIHIRQNINSNNKDNFQLNQTKKIKQLSKYKSTPNLINDFDRRQLPQQLDKTQKNNKKSSQQRKQKKGPNNFVNQIPGQTIYVDRILQVQSRVPGKMRHMQSSKARPIRVEYCDQSYSDDQNSYLVSRYNQRQQNRRRSGQDTKRQIESKIKFLIDRDKKNKAMEKHLKKQQQRIKHLQLVIKQKPKIKVSSDIISLSQSSSSSEMTLINTNVINKFKKGNKNQKFNVESQSKQELNQRNSAHFGIKEQLLNDKFQNQLQQDCQCSKTLNNDEDQSQINTDLKQSEQSGFSDFGG